MTRRLGRGDAQRGRARLALTTVTLLTVGLLLGLSPAGPLTSVKAEVNGTPTSTTTESNAPANTPTPTPPVAPTIELINPSTYVTPVVVSNKGDHDTNYHLVAWVGNVDALTTPTVDFEITATNQLITLPAARIGTTDTWHAFWNVSQNNGSYNVTAKLFDGTTPKDDSDPQAVTVDKSAETVEMTYPDNGEPLGMFDPLGSADFGFIVDATVSAGATGVRVFYSTSPAGTKPNWRRCAQEITVSYSTQGNRRIGCTVPNTHFSSDQAARFELRGVAIVAEGTDDFDPGPPASCTPPALIPGPPPLCPTVDSGDAHRVYGYIQAPSSVTIDPPTVTRAPNNCQELTATVRDNQNQPIWRANVDVHAVGPTDALQFGAIAGRTRDWQPADSAGHSGNEATSNCGGSGTPPQQAEHDTPGAGNDPKHIETKPAEQPNGGADTSGGFTFALRSSQTGQTDVGAWADSDNDDENDQTDPSGGATITWATPTPTPTPTQTPTATTTPTTTPTATTSSTTSPTTSPSATRSPTTSSSPTASGSPSPSPSSRTITLETSKNTIVFGKSATFSGVVNSDNASCESGQTVKLQQQTTGAAGFSEVATAVTDAGGVYRLSFKPGENANYRALVDPSASCQEAISATIPVLVRAKVGLTASDKRVRKGQKVTFRATVKPCDTHAATDVVLYRRIGKKPFQEIGRKGLNARCQATFKQRVKKDSTYQARWPSQDDDHESGVSRKRKVEVQRVGRRNFLI